MSAGEAAVFVEDGEHLVRECSSGNIRGNGTVKPRAFVATEYPLEISAHRDAHCDEECPTRNRSRAAVMVVAGVARQLESKPDVRSDPPPKDHAIICLTEVPTVKTKAELEIEMNAKLFKRHDALCRELASIAMAYPRARSPAVIS